MRGSIREKSKGSWQIQIYTGNDAKGKPVRHFETVHAPKKSDAQKVLNKMLVDMEKGMVPSRTHLTVAEHLHNWLAGYVRTNCSIRTLDDYQSIIEHHLIPTLGQVQLKQLHPQVIQSYYSKACETLSARSVHKHHMVLSEALKYAVRQGYLGRNPCELVDPPSPLKINMRTLTESEVGVFLEAAQDSRFYPVFYTAVSSGLRQAELLGLRQRDLDLDMLSISVSRVLYKRNGVCQFKEPKTAHSRRRVAMTPKLALYLRKYQTGREQLYELLKKPLTLDDLVFSSVEGKPIDPGVLSHAFGKIAKQAGLQDVHFHTLRHTFGSLMLLRGAKPKVISEALGHSSVGFTLDVYSHIIEGMQSDAMDLLDEVLPAGVFSKNNAKLTPSVDITSSKN